MKKTTLNIIIASILAGIVFTGCSAKIGETADTGTINTAYVSVTDEESSESASSSSSSSAQSDSTSSTKKSSSESSSSSSSSTQSGSTSSTKKSSSESSSSSSSSAQSGTTSSTKESSSENSSQNDNSTSAEIADSGSSQVTIVTEINLNTSGILDTSDLFSTRDLTQTADLSSAKPITVSDGKTIEITEEGVYVISGTAKDCTIKVNADDTAKVQLVLDGVTITNSSAPAIYVVSADKCFVTTTDSENALTVSGSFTADGETNTDAVIFSKDDLVLNGVGTLTISSTDNGISGKDDIKITGGTYNITSTADAIEANDSIRICGGTFNIKTSKDGLHSENDEDDTRGYIFISDGSFTINAASDGIQATTAVQIDGGTLNITASEGIEGTYVQINGGSIDISASDDGINGSQKSRAYSTPVIEINGGDITIIMGQGDTDAVDVNGNIIVSGGTINITAQSSFDYDGTAQYNGGTIIINGSQVDSIPQSMMGGGMFGGMGGSRGGRGF